MSKRFLRCLCAAVLMGALTSGLMGCRFSNELIEVRYDQSASIIDYDTDQKNYVPNPEAEIIHDSAIPVYTEQDIDGVETIEEIVPIFSTPANTDTPVEQVFYDPESPLDRTAPLFSMKEEPEEQEDQPEERPDDQNPTEVSGYGEGAAEGVSDGGEEGDEGEGEAEGDAGDVESSESTHKPSDRGEQVFNASGGLLEPLTDVHRVATVGEYANLIQVIGGPGVLCAADDDFLDDSATKRIFKGKPWNIAKVASAWEYDADEDSYTVNFDALVASEPDLVLVPEGVNLLTEKQIAKLNAQGTSVEPAPKLNSQKSISLLATWLGNSLLVTDAGYDAQVRADMYTEQFVGSDMDALIASNGGLTSYNGVDYSDSGAPVNLTADNWTVLVTDWDASATYHAQAGGSPLWTSKGLALAHAGYGWSPANYYLSAGGVNNNAAQFPDISSARTQDKTYPIWQFNLGQLSAAADNFTGIKKPFSALKSSGDAACLVRAPASFSDVADESDVVSVLGAPTFRYVLCANQDIAKKMTDARTRATAAQEGLYAAYDWRTAGLISGVGYVTPSQWLIEAWIGNLPAWSVPNRSSICAEYEEPYGIRAVGNGLYCDWLDGSAESYLLAFWVNDFYDSEDSDYTSFKSEATAFYRAFYEYELTESDLKAMLSGKED